VQASPGGSELPGVPLFDFKSAINDTLANTFIECGLSQDLFVIRTESSVADGTSIYAVGRGRKRAILLVSPAKFPEVVSEDQAKAAAMRNYLGEELGSVILIPLAQGHILNRSYALMPFRRTYSDNRLFWAVQKHRMKPQVIEWLQAVNVRYRVIADSASDREQFIRPLQYLNTMLAADQNIGGAASTALDRLLAGKFQPCFVPMHNDLWKGNFLQRIREDACSKAGFRFFIIDWRGSRINGFPIYDLVRVSLSYNLTPNELNAAIIRATAALECDPVDALTYVTVALGEIALRVDQFPPDQFLQLARECIMEMQRAKI
jgi:hypothetical protein